MYCSNRRSRIRERGLQLRRDLFRGLFQGCVLYPMGTAAELLGGNGKCIIAAGLDRINDLLCGAADGRVGNRRPSYNFGARSPIELG
jgi:hypothetical protein